jgi:transcriptional regulator with XRE-family HTH domain
MAKISRRASSRYAQEALELFAKLLRTARIERRMTAEELAERAGVSRGLIHRLEAGSPGTSLGVAFEVAAILGIPLFDAGQSMTANLDQTNLRLRLLPSAVRTSNRQVDDDF